jgi:hypothetical protein
VTARDVKIATFLTAIQIAKQELDRYGALPRVGIHSVISRLQEQVVALAQTSGAAQ